MNSLIIDDLKPDIKENDLLKLDNDLLSILLSDRSSGKNIIWATGDYVEAHNLSYAFDEQITVESITGKNGGIIKPRTEKSKREQEKRIRTKAEVFTPSWICNKQNNLIDAAWFGYENAFNFEDEKSWTVNPKKVEFLEGKTWQDYVKAQRLEITCGEAPYLASRYDTVDGRSIPVTERIGLLDRKLRIVCENVDSEPEWYNWATEAVKSVYGYDWQGDNVLLARENLLATFVDFYEYKFAVAPIKEYLREIADVLSWNIWQMDGLKFVIPNSCKPKAKAQMSLFDDEEQLEDCEGCIEGDNSKHTGIYSVIKDWQTNTDIKFYNLLGGNTMKFDFIIGNPPFNEDTVGEQTSFAPPVYNIFMDEAYKLADRVELIHPARFLFDAGSTPKKWNEKMLHDEHLMVCDYFPKSSSVFPDTDIKGGVAITYRDAKKDYGAIEIYSVYPEVNTIKQKVIHHNFESFNKIVYTRTAYRLTNILHKEHPEAISQLSDGHAYDMSTNIFSRLPQVFFDECPNDGDDYVQIYGLVGTDRAYKFIKRKYVKPFANLDSYKVFVPKSNGSGALGEVLSTPVIGQPVIGQPVIGHTETFISIGNFKTENEATACLKYVKSKFARVLLGILKITQDNPPAVWKFVPMQDFTSSSDIDWSQSVAEIDVQLYKKYGLDDKEISFIETHVKEME